MNQRLIQLLIILVFFTLLSGPVNAYYLSIDAPAQIKVGEPILVTGSTNTPPPDKVDIIFSHSINVPVEISRESIQITEKGDNSFNVTFNTEGLEKGNYKIEALSQSQRDFSGGSRSLRVIKLIDRSDLITFTAPTWQEFEKELNIEAKIAGYTENAIQMEIKKGDNGVFGPESIPVEHGIVKYKLPIQEAGSYDISFSDYEGYIGKYTIVTEEKDKRTLTDEGGILTHEVTAEKTTNPEQETTEKIAETRENENTEIQPVSQKIKEKITGISASADVSRDSPAYFLVETNTTPIIIQTSDNSDWVIEYKLSADSAGFKVNEEMDNASETITITDPVSEIFLKIYPYSYKASETITVTADLAGSLELSDKAAKAFGVPPRYGDSSEKGKKETPLPAWTVLLGLGISLLYVVKRT